jgi:hypothetical protein
MDFRRSVRCANCRTETVVSVSTDLELKEIIVAGKCRCGSTLQATYDVVSPSGASQSSELPKPQEPQAPEPVVNLDESIFGGGDLPSDTLRDLMEE